MTLRSTYLKVDCLIIGIESIIACIERVVSEDERWGLRTACSQTLICGMQSALIPRTKSSAQSVSSLYLRLRHLWREYIPKSRAAFGSYLLAISSITLYQKVAFLYQVHPAAPGHLIKSAGFWKFPVFINDARRWAYFSTPPFSQNSQSTVQARFATPSGFVKSTVLWIKLQYTTRGLTSKLTPQLPASDC